jgi:uncharacterized alpha-E superfamily protein
LAALGRATATAAPTEGLFGPEVRALAPQQSSVDRGMLSLSGRVEGEAGVAQYGDDRSHASAGSTGHPAQESSAVAAPGSGKAAGGDVDAPVPGASRAGHDYLVTLTIDRELPGSLAFAIDRYGSAARAVRDQLPVDTWMILGAVDRALAGYPAATDDLEAELSEVHSRTLAGLLALSGIDGESLLRDTGWYVRDIGKRVERGLALTALLSAALTKQYPDETEREVTAWVLRVTESAVSYRRRHRDSVRIASVAELLLFDTANPRSLAYQLDRLHARRRGGRAAARRMLRRLDPDDLEVTDADDRRTELAELLEGVHLRLRKVSESFETTTLSLPVGIQPLWGSAQVVG